MNPASALRPLLSLLALAMERGDAATQDEALRLFRLAQERIRRAAGYFAPNHPRHDRDLPTTGPGWRAQS